MHAEWHIAAACDPPKEPHVGITADAKPARPIPSFGRQRVVKDRRLLSMPYAFQRLRINDLCLKQSVWIGLLPSVQYFDSIGRDLAHQKSVQCVLIR
jgi:hypothetical protein